MKHLVSSAATFVVRRRIVVALVVVLGVTAPIAVASMRSPAPEQALGLTPAFSSAAPGGGSTVGKPLGGVAKAGEKPADNRPAKVHELRLRKAGGAVFDVRKLVSDVVRQERPEHPAPNIGPGEAAREAAQTPLKALPRNAKLAASKAALAAAAPAPDSSFDGLDFANWGAGHPPDENGDVGPTYFIETVNTSIGIYDKSSGSRVAAFTFNSFMSQGHFGNLCDTDNFGDPVVLYDTFEDRWFITDFAFRLDSGGNINPQHAYQCMAVSKTGDPVNGGWNYYSIEDPGGLGDYPKFGVWSDGIYMSANMFGYASGASYMAPHVWALNKQEMYAGAPTAQVVDFSGPSSDFTLLPANARLQTGTPPAGSPEYFVSTEQFLNALSIYKLHVDWDKVSTSTFTGPETQLAPNCWPNATPANASTTANAADVLAIRAMAQAQYTNQGGQESVWVDHTVQRGVSATNTTCNATTGGNATIRWYQANVSGGTVAANVAQGATFDPEGANTFFRFIPSLAVDRTGDMAVGYTKSNATTNPQIKYAGRLASDPANTLGQSEQTLIDGTGSQSGNCGGAACVRWGDYSGMALDPNGCEFWETGEYYATSGLNDQTRIGSFHYPSCTPVGNGTLSGTVTDGTHAVAGVTVTLGSRTTTTDGSGSYSFTVPAGTYPSLTAAKNGFDTASTATIAVPDGGTATRNFTLNSAAQSGCFTDNSQTAFQRGVPTNCDLVSSPGAVVLSAPAQVDGNSSVSPTGFGISNTSWAGQTWTPTKSGQLTRVDVELFCAGCTANSPSVTLSIRNTTGTTPVPTGADLATASIAGFNDGGAGGLKTFTFASPISVTAGTRYAFVFRLSAAFASGTVAYTCSCATTGFTNTNPYASGQRVTSTNSGSSWTADTTVGGRDLNFAAYVNPGYASSGTFTSSLKDANPKPGSTAKWTTLSWTATTPAGTGVKFQVAASNNAAGPFSFVGPDGTSSTYFTTSGASLSQFDGFRYLEYQATLTTSSATTTPSLTSAQVCFNDVAATNATTLAVDPASGTYGGHVDLKATLQAAGSPVPNEPVAFKLAGASAGTATTDVNGVATLSNVPLTGIDAGSYPNGVTASFAGDASYDPSNGSAALTVAKAAQAITVTTHAPASAVYGSHFTVAATGGASGNPVLYGSSGACSNTGATFTMTSGTGTCTVTYDEAGNGNYDNAPQVTESVSAAKADQTISVGTHAPASAAYNATFTVAATASSGNPVAYGSSGACTNSDASFTITSGTGTCTVTYDQAGDANYNAAPQVTESVNATKASQTIHVVTHAPASAAFGTSFDVSATASSGDAVAYGSSGACSNAGSTFTMTSGTGTCTVTYDQAGNANYDAATQVVETVSATKAPQTITFTSTPPASSQVGDTYQPLATGGGSGNPVVFGASGACSYNGGTGLVTATSSGLCTVTADQAGDANYQAAPQQTQTYSVGRGTQTITVTTHAPSTAVYGTQFTVAATGGASGNPIQYGSLGACSNSGATYTMTSGTGTCTVTYDQAGNAGYDAAPQVTETVTAAKADQTIAFTSTPAPGERVGDLYEPHATGGGSGKPVLFGASGACSYNGGTGLVTMTSPGTCTVTADQAGNANYNAASQATQTFSVGKGAQTITVTTHAPSSAVFGSHFTVAANGGPSGNPVVYGSSGACSNAGATFTMTSGTGTCTVTYDQAGNATYDAATQVVETVSASKAPQSITFTSTPPSNAHVGDTYQPQATGGPSGNPVVFGASGACSYNGGTGVVTANSAGTCTVTADQAASADYAAAPQVTQTYSVGKGDQTIAFAPLADKTYGNPDFTVSATATSGLAVSFSASGQCTVSGSTVHLTGAGSCQITASQGGNDSWNAAPSVSRSFSIAIGQLIITASDRSKLYGQTLVLGSTAFTTSGLASGDGIASVTLTSAGADASAAPGTYPIVPSAAVAASGTNLANYAISYVSGTLTVSQSGGLVGLTGIAVSGAGTTFDSFDSSLGAYGSGNSGRAATLFGNGLVDLRSSFVGGSVRSTQDSVLLAKGGEVTGDVVAGKQIQKNGTIDGTATQNAPSTPLSLTPVSACSPYSSAAGLGGQFTYNAATGDLIVGANKAATLAAGTYCFHSISMSKGATITISGAVTITLNDVLTAPQATFVNPSNNPANLVIMSSYGDAGGLNLMGGAGSYMKLYGPRTEVVLSGQFYGTALANLVTVKAGTAVHVDVR